jgi:hypothetical protein
VEPEKESNDPAEQDRSAKKYSRGWEREDSENDDAQDNHQSYRMTFQGADARGAEWTDGINVFSRIP